MPLIKDTLASDLTDIATNYPASHSEAGQRWAAAYGSYAGAAVSPTGGAPVVAGAIGVLASALGAAFAAGGDATPAMTAAFVAFWAGPPIAFFGLWPGIITTPPSGLDLASVFKANIDGQKSAADSCAAIAAELHSFTTTAICTDTTIVAGVPTPVVGPIS